MGRKRAELDYNIIDTALYYGATMNQVMFLLEKKDMKYTRKTIERCIKRDKGMTFSEYREYCHGGSRLKLAQKQFEVAMSGNATLLIWLGKQWLGQKDKLEQSVDEGTQKIFTLNYSLPKED